MPIVEATNATSISQPFRRFRCPPNLTPHMNRLIAKRNHDRDDLGRSMKRRWERFIVIGIEIEIET